MESKLVRSAETAGKFQPIAMLQNVSALIDVSIPHMPGSPRKGAQIWFLEPFMHGLMNGKHLRS